MITCYYGRLGTGKTYAMTAEVLRQLNKGRVVYTNYSVRFPDRAKKRGYPESNLRRFEGLTDLLDIERGSLLALDEGYLYFDSYVGTKMPLGVRKWILFSRHLEIDIFYTAQRPMSVQVTMRAMTEDFWRVSSVWTPIGRFFVRRLYDLQGEDVNELARPVATRVELAYRQVFNSYNTHGSVFMKESDYLLLAESLGASLEKVRERFSTELEASTPHSKPLDNRYTLADSNKQAIKCEQQQKRPSGAETTSKNTPMNDRSSLSTKRQFKTHGTGSSRRALLAAWANRRKDPRRAHEKHFLEKLQSPSPVQVLDLRRS